MTPLLFFSAAHHNRHVRSSNPKFCPVSFCSVVKVSWLAWLTVTGTVFFGTLIPPTGGMMTTPCGSCPVRRANSTSGGNAPPKPLPELPSVLALYA